MKYILICILLMFGVVLQSQNIYVKKSKSMENMSKKVSTLDEEKLVNLDKPPFDILSDRKEQINRRLKKVGLDDWYKIELKSPIDINKFKKELKNNPDVIDIADEIIDEELLDFVPNDTHYDKLWHMKNTGQGSGTSGLDLDMELAWDLEKGDTNVVIAVMDNGVNYVHEDLIGNMHYLIGYDFANSDWSIEPDDHGSRVASVIAAETNNSKGVSGIAGGSGNDDGVRILSCQITGSGTVGHISAIIWAAEMGASIINCSFKTSPLGVGGKTLYQNAIYYFMEYGGGDECEGGLVIAASGNDTTDLAITSIYPAMLDSVLVVAALDNTDTISAYSNYGTQVDVCGAAGDVSIYDKVYTASYHSGIPNHYEAFFGTSCATPVVSGVAALIISYRIGELTNEDVRYILINSAEDVSAQNPTFTGKLGSGRVNAYQALLMADSVANSKNVPTLIFQF